MIFGALWPLLRLSCPYRDLGHFLSVGVDAEDDSIIPATRSPLRFCRGKSNRNLRGDFTKEKFENLNPLLSREKKAKLGLLGSAGTGSNLKVPGCLQNGIRLFLVAIRTLLDQLWYMPLSLWGF